MNTSGWALAGVGAAIQQAAADHQAKPDQGEAPSPKPLPPTGPIRAPLDQGGDSRTTRKAVAESPGAPSRRPGLK